MHDLIAAARDLAPAIAARAAEIEAARRLPPDIAEAFARAGFYRMAVPEAVGGVEAPPQIIFDTIAAIAEADASAAWCIMIGATSALNSAYLPIDLAREVFGDPGGVYAGVFAPMGRAIDDGDAHRVSGRWSWGSGSQNAHWIAGGAMLMDGAKPRLGEDGAPMHRMMIFRREDVEFHDTWRVMGLCGTGSLDFSVSDVRVPKARSVSLISDKPAHRGPLYAFPAFGLLGAGIAAVALGNAKAALSEFRTLASAKKPQASRRTLSERSHTQLEFAQASAQHASAAAFFRKAIADAWDAAQTEGAISLDLRAQLRLATTHATRTCSDVCRAMHELAGGTSVYAESTLQRRFRDASVMTQHMMVAPPTYEVTGRVLLGVPLDDTAL